MRHFFVVIILLVWISPLTAQTNSIGKQKAEVEIIGKYYPPNPSAEGSPYYYKSWQPGLIYFETGGVSNPLKLKFNAQANLLIIAKNDDEYFLNMSHVKKFALFIVGDKKMFKKGFSSDKYEINSYEFLQVIYDGKIDLIAKQSVELFRSYTAMGGEATPEYITHQNYYLVTKIGSFIR